LINFKAK